MNNNLSRTIGTLILITFNIILLWLIKNGPSTILERINWLHVIIISILIWTIVQIFSLIFNKDRQLGILYHQEIKNWLGHFYEKKIDTTKGSTILWQIANVLVLLCTKSGCILSLIIVFTIIPRLIVGIRLIIDVIYYSRLEFMYKDLVLLLIPVIFDVICVRIKHEAERNMRRTEERGLIVNYKDGELSIENKDKEKTKARYWIKNFHIIIYMISINVLQIHKHILYWRIITLVLYITSWTIYILK
jgi:hypothetical protein